MGESIPYGGSEMGVEGQPRELSILNGNFLHLDCQFGCRYGEKERGGGGKKLGSIFSKEG